MIEIANTGIEAIFSGLMAAFFAQLIKFIIFTIKSKKINFKIFTTTGGMPSSHSAGVMGLSTSVGLIKGFDSIVFAIALGYALITMYDAAGVRRAAGKTAACLNRMMEDFYKHDVQAIGGKLKELLGHTPLEVIMGAIFGILFAYCYHMFLIS
ncbi:divergent PAP2 family protein [Spirochaetes bacterium]|uniref:Divergent PAP2 family protein n=1 Tax=Candidatus Scatousia excrementipullorum TaxID=2840936 RepID=A0A9D9DQK3_9BACT|nr:divergent PAP2 family protein [Candidatus Scatousia excrementipullorum]